MTIARPRPFGQNYAFVAVAAVFIALMAAAGLRSAPGVLMLPLERAFQWDRGTISMAAAVGIFLYGLTGPFAAALMQSFGVRRTVTLALAVMAASTAASSLMTQPWHYVATWGVISGVGSGAVAMVLGATVVNRWFVARRGLMMGLLSASAATASPGWVSSEKTVSRAPWAPGQSSRRAASAPGRRGASQAWPAARSRPLPPGSW